MRIPMDVNIHNMARRVLSEGSSYGKDVATTVLGQADWISLRQLLVIHRDFLAVSHGLLHFTPPTPQCPPPPFKASNRPQRMNAEEIMAQLFDCPSYFSKEVVEAFFSAQPDFKAANSAEKVNRDDESLAHSLEWNPVFIGEILKTPAREKAEKESLQLQYLRGSLISLFEVLKNGRRLARLPRWRPDLYVRYNPNGKKFVFRLIDATKKFTRISTTGVAYKLTPGELFSEADWEITREFRRFMKNKGAN